VIHIAILLRTKANGDWSVVEVEGELDLYTSPDLDRRLQELIGDGRRRIAIDLSSVPFMDSSSLSVLVSNLKRLREREGELALVGIHGTPLKVLTLTGLTKIFPLFESTTELPT